MNKIFKLAQIKDLLNQVYSEKITISRFVEILNQQVKTIKNINMKETVKLDTNNNPFNHLMLDIETMGNESFSSIVSIGALEFDIETGKTGREFYVNVDLQSCIDLGLNVNASTIMWWMSRDKKAIDSLTNPKPKHIKEALQEFTNFICPLGTSKGDLPQIWGNSARLDCGILQNAYNKLGISIPWDFRKERCVRTLVSFNPEIKNNFQSVGTAHNALSDCYFQVGYCSAIWSSLNNKQQ